MIKLVKSLKYLVILTCFFALTFLSGPLIVPKAEARTQYGTTFVVPSGFHRFCPEESTEVWCVQGTPELCWPVGGWFCMF